MRAFVFDYRSSWEIALQTDLIYYSGPVFEYFHEFFFFFLLMEHCESNCLALEFNFVERMLVQKLPDDRSELHSLSKYDSYLYKLGIQ